MKEILFRGKDFDGKWRYGFPFITWHNAPKIRWYSIGDMTDGIWKSSQVYKESFNPFTGAYDKEDNRIFENDIVKIDGEKEPALVKYNDDKGCFYLETSTCIFDFCNKDHFTVIGNAFEDDIKKIKIS